MAIYLNSASTQYLTCTNPAITDYPFTVGAWVKLSAINTVLRTIWGLTDTGTTNHLFLLRMSATEIVTNVAQAGGTTDACTGANISGLQWAFHVSRYLSSTQRRITSFVPGLAPITASDSTATARAPTGIDTMTIGAHVISSGVTNPWDGLIAEYWLARGDVFSDALDPSAAFMQALALGGPFSMPHIKVVDYMSFRKGFPAGGVGDYYNGGGARHVWTAVNGPVLVGAHPPLPYWYKRPDQVKTQLVI